LAVVIFMKLRRSILSRLVCYSTALAILTLVATPSAWAQTSKSSASKDPAGSNTLTRDSTAIELLSSAIAHCGASNTLRATNSLVANGAVTLYAGGRQQTGSAFIRQRGLHDFRLDMTFNDGVHSWIISGNSGTIRDEDGSTRSIPYHNSFAISSFMLPVLKAYAALQDAGGSITVPNAASGTTDSYYHVRTEHIFGDKRLSKLTSAEYLVDPASSNIVSIQTFTHPVANLAQDIPHEVQFSDYRPIAGICVPFAVTELVNGQRTLSLQLNSVMLNQPLGDADFDPSNTSLPALAGGQ
jgi:hypothetical protein